jgi:23S rRNA (cytosine1962-C5)-methyltransferase
VGLAGGRGPDDEDGAGEADADDTAGTGSPPEDGSVVEVRDASDRFIGHGLYNRRSDIRVRMLSRGRRRDLDRPLEFLKDRLRAADRLRRKTLRLDQTTDAYRVVHAEGDDLSGLVVDRLGSFLVCEHHALGFWRLRDEVEAALGELYPGLEVVHRAPAGAQRSEGFEAPPQHGREGWIEEDGLHYPVLAGAGHKTGWFCDQRDNRRAVGLLGHRRDVLDLCCNAGGFALHAARAGARRVRAVDLDEKVLVRARGAAQRNALEVEFRHADAYDVLREVRAGSWRPGLVVCDPHKLVRGRSDLEGGLKRYGDLNTLAFEAVRPGGLLATFSCSGAVDEPTFVGLLFGAARRAGREVRLLRQMGAGPDHPQRPSFPRSRYLKGALLAVD